MGFCTAITLVAAPTSATVFINEVLWNPPSGSDNAREFIELMGTPGMRLDGYAFAVISGGQRKVHPLSVSIPLCTDPSPPACVPLVDQLVTCTPEIDEFFSLDGLRLGPNGLLVLGRGPVGSYPNLLVDTSTRADWDNGSQPMWNGGLDTPGGMENDGSMTFMLVRRRPGDTQANCPAGNCGNLRWGKDVNNDAEFVTLAPPDDACMNFGNGNNDKNEPDGNGGFTLDLKGASTPLDASDDLEIVDELSIEDDQGWEYDEDDRHVDVGSASPALLERNVHALEDPQGFTADAAARVDYRTKGNGWAPVGGATGQMGNGNNWQDAATEQWIWGSSRSFTDPGTSTSPPFYFSNDENLNPDGLLNRRTFVPSWLRDGSGTEYNYTTFNALPDPPPDPPERTALVTYEIMSGRINPLAIPVIPGDTDRDGDCDADDISKLGAVFGDDDWIFSNGFEAAPQGDSGDPATQTRPWDVDATGDNGIEPSDLQWTLNFQGDATGRIVGVRYDSTTPTPPGSGVSLNSNAGTTVTISAAATNPCGHLLSSLLIGDTLELIVSAQVTAGANLTAGQENGVMQFVHDIAINTGGVLRVTNVQPLGSFAKTRASIESLQGVLGDLGVKRVNGYAVSFAQGLGSASQMYKVTLTAIAAGSAQVSIGAASEAKFAASTPRGVKIGHTLNTIADPPAPPLNTLVLNRIRHENGDPATTVYPGPIAVTVTSSSIGDVSNNGLTDVGDILLFVNVMVGVDTDPLRVSRSDLNCDTKVNGLDIPLMVDAVLP
jgi:hypothetical protein